ncbi:DUF4191 family protein [Rathayibacter toxicus]|uniref:DUF4191 domain-containing protein n=1 Tax=Rathayibacter toxicus TaxID=145458 RepID=A0A0C5BUR6_9MICO|nr:DUF4191 family protein [Rathayibacter toxicus]AJM78407.1 membrane protein [Rathayibacter toxicus]ALS58176.1 hypothetical protein APU90_00275 [Rathayibacter toxicus]KKM44772.1 membrane protein [Rathayibacter toxicus]PPG21948.1 DUF4191 domain-containing protein [Rathayibacter toxicus]PPG46910.1 DUF4191 domain-containing protein [Rathayibacter toxicus]
MARNTEPSARTVKEPGRLRQMWQVFQMTRRYDSNAVWAILLALLLPILIGILLGILLGAGNAFVLVLWVLVGVVAGLVAALAVLSRRAERAAYSQINGQPGAVGAVLRSGLRGTWTGSEMPVAVNGKTQDAVYRAVGRGGVVLITEGPASRTKRMMEDERRKVARILPNVPITVINVGPDDNAVPLHRVQRALAKTTKTLTKAEVLAVKNRLASLNTSLPIPKGVDPFKVRPQRPR